MKRKLGKTPRQHPLLAAPGPLLLVVSFLPFEDGPALRSVSQAYRAAAKKVWTDEKIQAEVLRCISEAAAEFKQRKLDVKPIVNKAGCEYMECFWKCGGYPQSYSGKGEGGPRYLMVEGEDPTKGESEYSCSSCLLFSSAESVLKKAQIPSVPANLFVKPAAESLALAEFLLEWFLHDEAACMRRMEDFCEPVVTTPWQRLFTSFFFHVRIIIVSVRLLCFTFLLLSPCVFFSGS